MNPIPLSVAAKFSCPYAVSKFLGPYQLDVDSAPGFWAGLDISIRLLVICPANGRMRLPLRSQAVHGGHHGGQACANSTNHVANSSGEKYPCPRLVGYSPWCAAPGRTVEHRLDPLDTCRKIG
jgi:hypothetical protein